MKKAIILGLSAISILTLFLTTPNDYQYKSRVKELYYMYNKDYVDTSATSFETQTLKLQSELLKNIAENKIESNVNSNNYLLFSIVNWDKNYIGYGFLGNIYISNDFEYKIKNIKSNL